MTVVCYIMSYHVILCHYVIVPLYCATVLYWYLYCVLYLHCSISYVVLYRVSGGGSIDMYVEKRDVARTLRDSHSRLGVHHRPGSLQVSPAGRRHSNNRAAGMPIHAGARRPQGC